MAFKYSSADKRLFIEIIARYPIIENKKMDVHNIEKRRKAWDNILAEYNAVATETRTMIQIKRLWDKVKRSRRSVLATTDNVQFKPAPSPRLELDNLMSQLQFKTENDADLNAEVSQEVSISPIGVAPSTSRLPTNHLSEIKQARLRLIEKEEAQMEELHTLRMEEAYYRKEAARLVMLQEEAKLKQINKYNFESL